MLCKPRMPTPIPSACRSNMTDLIPWTQVLAMLLKVTIPFRLSSPGLAYKGQPNAVADALRFVLPCQLLSVRLTICSSTE